MDKQRILIADDQADVLEALRFLLKGEGYSTEAVTSPGAARPPVASATALARARRAVSPGVRGTSPIMRQISSPSCRRTTAIHPEWIHTPEEDAADRTALRALPAGRE